MEDVSNSVLSLTEQYLESQSGIQEQAKEIGTMDVLEWCSAASPTDGFTINMRNATYEIGIQLRDAAVRIETEVKNMESDIQTIQTSIHNADEKLDEFKSYMNIAKIIVILIDIIVILLMIACILAWLEKQHYVSILVRNACIIPAFVILLLLFWIFSTLALLGSMAGSDFCASPDETAVSVILRFQDKMSSVMFNYLMYYVTVSTNCGFIVLSILQDISLIKTFIASTICLFYRVVCQKGSRQRLILFPRPLPPLENLCTINSTMSIQQFRNLILPVNAVENQDQ